MNELTKKQKKLRLILKDQYKIDVNNRWYNKYLWLYANCIPLKKITMSEAVDCALDTPDKFAYFIYGARAEYIEAKKG